MQYRFKSRWERDAVYPAFAKSKPIYCAIFTNAEIRHLAGATKGILPLPRGIFKPNVPLRAEKSAEVYVPIGEQASHQFCIRRTHLSVASIEMV